jgi:hypothetical protein
VGSSFPTFRTNVLSFPVTSAAAVVKQHSVQSCCVVYQLFTAVYQQFTAVYQLFTAVYQLFTVAINDFVL